ncbi:hypothetical protein [Lysobacter gummosus]
MRRTRSDSLRRDKAVLRNLPIGVHTPWFWPMRSSARYMCR